MAPAGEGIRMLNDILITASLVALAIVVAVYVVGRWQTATPEQKEKIIADTVARLVEVAEQRFKTPGTGQTKYGFVMNRLVSQFPDSDWDLLAEYVEAAVHRLNERKAAIRSTMHRNGAADYNA